MRAARLVGLLVALTSPASPVTGTSRAWAANLDKGTAIYLRLCARCHGESGNGKGFAAVGMNPPPRDFRDCDAMARMPDKHFYRVIRDGGAAHHHSANMPAYKGRLTEGGMRDVLAFIRTLCKKK